MTSRMLLILLGAAVVSRFAQAADPPAPAARRPNVIFFIVDDQRRDEFGFLGGKALTPNIDRLAAGGVSFPNGFTTSTVCTPSRYTCLTGRYPSQCTAPAFARDVTPEGMTFVAFNTLLELDRPNVPRVLQQEGYTTGFVGKWHVGVEGYRERVPPPGSDPGDPKVAALLRENQEDLAAAIRSYGFDFATNIYAGNALDSAALRHSGCTAHNMEWLTDGALRFLDQYGDRPFYLYFATTLPHHPVPLESLQGDPRITAGGWLERPLEVQPSRRSVLDRVRAAGLPDAAAGPTWIDDGLGAILRKLDELGIADDTLILFFNDHGMEHASKNSLYDGAVRTPILAYWPGRVRTQVRPELAQNVDFAPTIFDACGVTPPAEMDLRGASLLPLLEGEQPARWREFVYSEIGYTRALTGRRWKYLAFRLPPSAAVAREESMRLQAAFLDGVRRDHPWVKWEPDPDARITHTAGPPGGDFLTRLTFAENPPFLKNYFDPDQLYDLRVDPLEATNLAADPAHASRLRTVQAALKTVLADLPGTFGELKPTP